MHPQYPQLGQAGWGEGRRGTDSVCLVHGCMPRPAWLKYLWDEFQLTGNPLLAQLAALAVPVSCRGASPTLEETSPAQILFLTDISVKSLIWVSNLGGVGAHGAFKKNKIKTVTSTF